MALLKDKLIAVNSSHELTVLTRQNPRLLWHGGPWLTDGALVPTQPVWCTPGGDRVRRNVEPALHAYHAQAMGAAVMRAFIHPDDTSVPRGEPHSSTVFYPDGSFELRANQHVVDRLQTDPRHTSRVAYLYGLRADSFQPAPAGPCYPEETADQQLMWISHKPVEPTVIALLGRRVFDLGSIEALPPSDLLATYSDPAA